MRLAQKLTFRQFLPTQDLGRVVIFTKFHIDWVKIEDHLSIACFWASPLLFSFSLYFHNKTNEKYLFYFSLHSLMPMTVLLIVLKKLFLTFHNVPNIKMCEKTKFAKNWQKISSSRVFAIFLEFCIYKNTIEIFIVIL